MQHRSDQIEIIGQALTGMMAVDVGEADRLPAKLFLQLQRGDLATVCLPAQIAIGRNAVSSAVCEKPTFNAGIRPIEAVDAECPFTRRETERHCDEKAAFESTEIGRASC